MTEICLAKYLPNTLCVQLNKKTRPSNYLLEKAKEAREIFFLTKGLGHYREATGKSSGFQGESKYKENVAKHVFSTNDSYRESEEFSSMGKQLVLCKNSSKLADSRKVKTFFRRMGDAYKATKNFRNCKGVQNTFSRMFSTGENFPDATHGSRRHENRTC